MNPLIQTWILFLTALASGLLSRSHLLVLSDSKNLVLLEIVLSPIGWCLVCMIPLKKQLYAIVAASIILVLNSSIQPIIPKNELAVVLSTLLNLTIAPFISVASSVNLLYISGECRVLGAVANGLMANLGIITSSLAPILYIHLVQYVPPIVILLVCIVLLAALAPLNLLFESATFEHRGQTNSILVALLLCLNVCATVTATTVSTILLHNNSHYNINLIGLAFSSLIFILIDIRALSILSCLGYSSVCLTIWHFLIIWFGSVPLNIVVMGFGVAALLTFVGLLVVTIPLIASTSDFSKILLIELGIGFLCTMILQSWGLKHIYQLKSTELGMIGFLVNIVSLIFSIIISVQYTRADHACYTVSRSSDDFSIEA